MKTKPIIKIFIEADKMLAREAASSAADKALFERARELVNSGVDAFISINDYMSDLENKVACKAFSFVKDVCKLHPQAAAIAEKAAAKAVREAKKSNFSYSGLSDVELYYKLKSLKDFGFNVPSQFIDYYYTAVQLWRKGYSIECEIDGVIYAYGQIENKR